MKTSGTTGLPKLVKLEKQISNDSWTLNPDRMSGAFTEREKLDVYTWR